MKLSFKKLIAPSALMLAFSCSPAFADQAADLSVENSFVREMPPMSPATGAFMLLKNKSNQQITVIGASSDAANKVELHTHLMDDGVMRMRKTDEIQVPANGSTVLEPGGLHIMLIEPQPGLVEGKKVQLTLQLQDGSSKQIEVPVRKMQGLGMPNHKHQQHHHH